MYLYLDSGFFYGYSEIPEDSEFSTSRGFPVSTGIGTALSIRDTVDFNFSYAFPLTQERLDGRAAVFEFSVGLHF